MGRLDGCRCMIVGGTGGLGLAMCRRFLEEGASVVAAGHMDQAGAVADERLSGPIWEYTAHAEDEADVGSLFEFALRLLNGRIDVLVHVAGISGRRFGDGPLDQCTTAGWDKVLEINARSVFLTNRDAVQRMMAQEPDADGMRGVVMNVGTVLDRSPAPHHFGTVAYAASKGAIRAMTMASAARYAGHGIRIGLIEPALVDTPMATRAVGDPQIQTYLQTKMPLSQGALRADAVAEAAVFFASREARGMTGSVLTVDGGWCLSEGQHGEPK